MLIIIIFALKDTDKQRLIVIGIIFLIIFFSYTKFLELKYNNAFIDIEENEKLIVKIISTKEKGDYYNKYVGRVEIGKYQKLKIIVYAKEENEFQYGEVIEFVGIISKPNVARNQNGFNYSKYLREKKIAGIIQVENYKKLRVEKDFFYYMYKLKYLFLDRVERMYNDKEIGFINAILFGEISELDKEISEDFKLSNLYHVLSISGMHISYIVIGTETLLNKWIKNIKIKYFIIIMFLTIFMPFVGGSASVVRACIMTIITYIAKIFLEKEDFYSSFLITLFIILVVNPYNINSISMWLSFGGSIGIVVFNKFLNKCIVKKINKKKILIIGTRKREFILKIIENAVISISAQIIITPVMLYYFNTISFTFWISNVLISSLVGPILILGYLSVLVYPLGICLAYFEKILIHLIFIIAHICTKIPFNQIFLISPKLYIVIAYYCLIFYLIQKFSKNKVYYLKRILNNKYIVEFIKRKWKSIQKVLLYIVLMIILLVFLRRLPQNFRINFLDVGQGDCTLIRTTENKVLLIDSGEGNSDKYDYGQNVVFPYLLDEGIMKIDYMIISHFDSDHVRWNVLYIREYEC